MGPPHGFRCLDGKLDAGIFGTKATFVMQAPRAKSYVRLCRHRGRKPMGFAYPKSRRLEDSPRCSGPLGGERDLLCKHVQHSFAHGDGIPRWKRFDAQKAAWDRCSARHANMGHT